MIPTRLKFGAADNVEKMVLSAVAGVRLSHAPQVPAATPVPPGHYQFRARAARHPVRLYDRMLQSRLITVYASEWIVGLQLELFVGLGHGRLSEAVEWGFAC